MTFNRLYPKYFQLVIFLTPLYLLKINLFNIFPNILDILMLVAIFWQLPNFLTFFSKKYRFEGKFFYGFFIGLILLGLIISSLLNDNLFHNFAVIGSWFVLPLCFVLTIFFLPKKQSFQQILSAIFYSSFTVALISLFYFIANNLTYDHRLKGFYSSPNYLAMYLAPGFIIGIFKTIQSFQQKNYLSFYFFLLLTILTSTSLYLTYSYATWLAILGSFTIIIFLIKKFTSPHIYLFLFLFFIILLFTQFNNPKLRNIIPNYSHSSLSSRVIIWKSALKILSDNYIWGIGADNFQEKYLQYQKYFPPYPEWAVPQPHNLYLAFWLHSGLMGLLGFICLIIFWLKNQIVIILYSNSKKQKWSALILLTIIFYILLHGLVDTPLWKNDLALLFWLIIFLGMFQSLPHKIKD